MGRLISLVCASFILVSLAACGRGEIVRPVTPTVFVPSGAATATAVTAAENAAATQAAAGGGDIVEAGPVGDAANGQVLFNNLYTEVGFACSTCHNVASEARLIGPGLQHVSQWAAENITDQTPEEYLYESIVAPNAYIVPADPPYPANLMPQTYAQLFTEQQLQDLVAYLMTL